MPSKDTQTDTSSAQSESTHQLSQTASHILASSLAALAPISIGELYYPQIDAATAAAAQSTRSNTNRRPSFSDLPHEHPNAMAYFTTHHFAPPKEHSHHDEVAAPAGERTSSQSHRKSSDSFLHSFTHHPNYQPVGRLAHMIDNLHLSLNARKEKAANEAGSANPHFDLAESSTAFTIYGELPGIGPGVGDVTVAVDDALATVSVAGLLVRGIPQGVEIGELNVAHEKAGEERKEEPTAEAAEPKETLEPPKDAPEETAPAVTEGPPEPKETAPAVTEAPPEPKETPPLTWHSTERQVGQFQRVFHFASDEVVASRVHAGLRYGLLTIVVPKRVESVPNPRGGEHVVKKSGRKITVSHGPPREEDFSLAHAFP